MFSFARTGGLRAKWAFDKLVHPESMLEISISDFHAFFSISFLVCHSNFYVMLQVAKCVISCVNSAIFNKFWLMILFHFSILLNVLTNNQYISKTHLKAHILRMTRHFDVQVTRKFSKKKKKEAGHE
jgi:hypothetical protein